MEGPDDGVLPHDANPYVKANCTIPERELRTPCPNDKELGNCIYGTGVDGELANGNQSRKEEGVDVMVRVSTWGVSHKFAVDNGYSSNGRIVDTVKTTGKVDAHSEGVWLIFPDTYLRFVGNHAIIHPNPTPIDRAKMEHPMEDISDGS